MALGCEIIFDQNEHGVYLSGQVLSGRVELTLEKPKKLKGVHITIGGQARTCWNEHQRQFVNGRPKTKEIFYQADETYLESKAYLKKGLENDSDSGVLLELPTGKHVYTFSCALHPMLPTSFEGLYGYIRYTVKVVLERPWKFDQTYKVAFTVLKELDLNFLSPILRIPTQMETATNFWCGPCTSGIFSMVASVPQSGYVAGQVIDVTAEVTNMTKIPVDYIKCSLRKVVLYKSQIPLSKTKVEFDVVQERRVGRVDKMSHGRIEVQLAIPPIPPTNTCLCKVIEITYEIKVEARVSGLHNNPFIIIPLTIGTVPLSRQAPDPPAIQTATATTEQPHLINVYPTALPPPSYSPTEVDHQQPIMSMIVNAQRNQIADLPPPSYEESQTCCNHKIEDDEERHSIHQQPSYTPRYQVYHFDQQHVIPVSGNAPAIIEVQQPEPRPETLVEAEVITQSHAMKLQETVENWQ